MDEFFQLYNSPGSISWFEEALLVDQSAFVRYADQPFEALASRCSWKGSNHRINVNRRMIEFLKRSQVAPAVLIEVIEPDKDRIHKHRMDERMRREKHKQGYVALHELLPFGTKSDKKSILEMAAKEIEELQKYKKELKRQNRGMEMVLDALKNETAVEKAEIKLKVAYPASGVDSMLEVLRCLKNTGSTATAIQSSFSEHEFDAVLEIETKIRAQDVEKAVQRTLFEAERKFRHQL
ncbi:UNVERIFIED_CONTAM: hypothetical protein Slati_1047500 [Sesamum latifolium]|uniref:BHLH domain-containing protein n=1 Tax=Sesamum latifolium TaxID=2727402 RepID=A0AAW2XT52_9LAMI